MPAILLTAFNARYAHTAFGLRYLLANLGDLQPQANLLEFDLSVQPRTAVEQMLQYHPRIIALTCTIWNIDLITSVAALLKTIRPDIYIILGGPEISYETEQQAIYAYADYVICGEGELEFPKYCKHILTTQGSLKAGDTPAVLQASCLPLGSVSQASSLPKIIHAEPVDITKIELPYHLYTDEDIAHRAIYVEASRGCPFRCEYCMSSLDANVRYFPENALFSAFARLLQRGAKQFKFVDRSFNIDTGFAVKLIQFFRERYVPGMMLHFEVIPDRLPEALLEAIKLCPPGMLQFEIGIQTLNEEVAHRIQRPLNIQKIEANLQRLRQETEVHMHADLIAGLPGEDLDSFASGFNRLLALNPHEIQLGILKRLRGAPIARHTQAWDMTYSPYAPYEILQTSSVPFADMQRIQRFARFWNLTVNNGQFIQTAPLIWHENDSAFDAFMAWSDWLYQQTGTTGNIALLRLAKLLFDYLSQQVGLSGKQVATALSHDYQRGNRPDLPGFLKAFDITPISPKPPSAPGAFPRQRRHAG